MNDNIVDNNSFIEFLKNKLEQEQYKLQDSFMNDLDELISSDRYREFIFVSHNYISEMLDKIVLNYFVTLEKREEFEIRFDIPKLSFSKKLNIIKKSNLIPKELCKVLSDFNKIRNVVAHNVDWLEKINRLNKLVIKKDKDFLYDSVPLWFMFLILYMDFSMRSNEERKQLDKDLEILAKEFGTSVKEFFIFE